MANMSTPLPPSRAEATGLMAFWASIEAQNEMAFLQWHNTEHIPERVAIPGFLLGRRYRKLDQPQRFLMCYDTLGEEVLTSEAYLRALNNPTPRTRQALAWFRQPVRNVYRQRWSAGQVDEQAPPLVVTTTLADAAGEPAAGLRAASGVLSGPVRVARYGLDSKGSGVRTNEAGIHGATSGQSGDLLWLECHDLDLLDDEQARVRLSEALRQWSAGAAGALEIYWLDFAKPGA